MRDEFSLQMYLQPGESICFTRDIIVFNEALPEDLNHQDISIYQKWFYSYMELVTFLQKRNRNECNDAMD